MTTIAAFFPKSVDTLFDQNVVPIKGGKLYFYDAGTTTPRTVYKDDALALAHSSPVLTDGFGRIPNIWIGLGKYKAVIKDASDALITQIDGLPGATETAATPDTATSGWSTGDLKTSYSDAVQDGWLPLNAKTIGNATSGGTARADADVEDLFTLLWNINANLAVSGGRGASASADFAASKTLTLPTGQGRALVGVDGMGNSLAGVLTSITTATPDEIGTLIGAQSVTLNIAQLPTFTPTVTIASNGAHTHTATTESVSDHTHGGTVDSNGAHTHTIKNSNVTAQLAESVRGIDSGGSSDQGTDSNGAHQHTFTTGAAGAHTHTLTTASNGDHTHTATASSIGSGSAHANVQPGLLCYIHIKI